MKILIIDDEKNICISLKNIFDDEGYTSQYANTCKEADKLLDEFDPDLIILDVKIKDENGLEFLESIRKRNIETPVVMISGHSGIREAVQAMKLGAFDFLEKPLNLTRIKLTVRNTFDFYAMKKDYSRMKEVFVEQYKIIGNSPKLLEMLEIIKKIAPTNTKVLIRGESGTGKELVAFAIHNLSNRSTKPFIKFNSAAIPTELIESELFGHEKGSFTGAIKSKKGIIELADKGTLFLDEIGDMSLSAQSKVLRVLQEGEIQRVGGSEIIKVDTRIIAATHKNLEEMITQGLFRDDLFYRLNVIPIYCPALRDRKQDISVLTEYFSKKFAFELKIQRKNFTAEALQILNNWSFPGNIRELKNLIERLYILFEGNEIKVENLKQFTPSLSFNNEDNFWYETKPFNDKKFEFEKLYLEKQLEKHNHNISKTADALNMQQSNLSRKLKELNP